jgi:hypothetical protein
MIRGAIEVVEPGRVSGWIYSSAETLRDQLIMGFVGNRCVGTGKVDRFRKDLLEAKLGDGYCGFDFPCRLLPDDGPGSLVIKLQNSDVALLQSSSRVFESGAEIISGGTAPDLGAVPPASVTWMQDNGWLEQHEHDFLKAIHAAGAYERGLRPARRAGEDPPPALKPGPGVQAALSVYMLARVDVAANQVASLAELSAEKSILRRSAVSVVGLWSEEPTRICVAERSHLGPREMRGKILPDFPPGGIDYQFGPERVLLLHRDCSFSAYGELPKTGITIFTGNVRTASGRANLRPITAARPTSQTRAA